MDRLKTAYNRAVAKKWAGRSAIATQQHISNFPFFSNR